MKSVGFITRNVLLGVGTAAIISLTSSQAADGWLVDFEKAKAQAAKAQAVAVLEAIITSAETGSPQSV